MGIPLLYPWANRLGARRFEVAGREVDLDAAEPPPSTDPQGLPIHGLLAAASGWEVLRHEETGEGVVEAAFDFTAHPGLLDAFPFPQTLLLKAGLDGPELTIALTVAAAGGVAGPGLLRLSPLPAAARGEARGMAGRDPGRRAPPARLADAAQR